MEYCFNSKKSGGLKIIQAPVNVVMTVEVEEIHLSRLDNVGGVFLVRGGGLVVAVIACIIDFIWNIRQIAIDETITPCEASVRELKFVIDLRQTTKPVGKGLEERSDSSRSSQSSKSDRSLKSAISKESLKTAESEKLDRV
ncbi:uncharacterized protein LOC129571880 [Sitodiplosis mosellana]|uniref:uncharacterized protein LOC129571880 n=1 Tax=Sitodiplosis mosellana TaxID=263140 RepID=UPI002444B464|nr:uncharacterized protein LOC129571880 [Sitodiplosis mosellana]